MAGAFETLKYEASEHAAHLWCITNNFIRLRFAAAVATAHRGGPILPASDEIFRRRARRVAPVIKVGDVESVSTEEREGILEESEVWEEVIF